MTDVEYGYTGDEKDNEKRLKKLQLEDQDKFIKKSYFLCLILFLASGLAMGIAVLQGAYKEVVIAETIIVTVLGTVYLVLFAVMLLCYSSSQLRIAVLLFVSSFVGVVCGFMIGVNLKVITMHLKDE
tara:strand:- start:206 stop:586 length:381 start_codon:yes stop_codon:yes gene_type:complete